MRCVAHSVPFDFDALAAFLRRSENAIRVLPGVTDVVHLSAPSAWSAREGVSIHAPGDAFIFEAGAIVLWNMSGEQERQLLQTARVYRPRQAAGATSVDSHRAFSRLLPGPRASPPHLTEMHLLAREESEEMDWLLREDGKASSDVKGDVIRVAWVDRTSDEPLKDRLAFSYALMQCVKLSVVETLADTTLDAMRGFSYKLARTGNANFITPSEVNQHIGEVTQLREFNLDSEIVETPEYFWEDSEREGLYQQLHRELQIGQRIAALNRKLSFAHESLQNLNSVVVNKHSTRLESRILLFVAFEACLDAAHLFGFLPEGGLKPLLTNLFTMFM